MYHRSEPPSGSRAPSRYHGENESESENESIYEEGDDACLPCSGHSQTEENSESALYESALSSGHTLPHGVPYTTKIPPQYNGITSWFTYEENVRDWVAMTTTPKEKQGPLLKSGLSGHALIFKQFLDRASLADPDHGVDYFLRELRPRFIKGASNVFLGRLIKFMKLHRGSLDFQTWIAKYELENRHLQDSWMDLLGDPITDIYSQDIRRVYEILCSRNVFDSDVQQAFQRQAITAEQRVPMLERMNDLRNTMHREAFPLNENLRTLLFTVASDLSSAQREAFTQHQTMRSITINHYQMQQVTDYFHQVICSQVTHLENPSLRRPVHSRGFRTFSVLEDYGECDGHYGFWAQDDEDGEERSALCSKRCFPSLGRRKSCMGNPKIQGSPHAKGTKERQRQGSWFYW